MNIERLKQRIKTHEGFASKGYVDNGQFSGGYGRKLPECFPPDEEITEAQAEEWLEEDIWTAVKDCERLFINFKELNDIHQEVLAEMAYNLGRPRLSGFKRMIAAIEEKDWIKAAAEMLNSRWAGQVKNRARYLAGLMREGIDDLNIV